MKLLFYVAISICLSLSASYASAEPPQLLLPVTASESAVARANNEYFLKKETYFAKRYRFVKVNTELLLEAERIRISLFDDLSVTLEVSSVDVEPGEWTIGWKGRFIEPSVSVDDLVAGGMSYTEAELLLPEINGLRISAGQISFDEQDRLKYAHYFPRFERFQNSSRRFSLDGESPIYDVVFMIQGIVLDKTYALRPLASDPQYHVLIELDPDKEFAKPIERSGPNVVNGVLETPENAARHQRYLDFLDSLGPDPRPSDIHKE